MLNFLATATLLVGVLAGTPQPPQWEASYGKALAATRSGEQPLLVVLDKPGSDAAKLDPQYLSEGAIEGKQFELLQPYRLCHVDVSTEYGQKVADAFHAKSFPYVAVIDKSGSEVIYRHAGKVQSDEWDRVLTSLKAGQRTGSTAVTRVSYKPTESGAIDKPSTSYTSGSYCPNCQRKSM